MYNAPYQGVANELAKYGRYGDSMLVHMNPIEVQMLASLSPTGRLTTNPVTGQQEAFLPFLAPLLGSFLGSSLLTGTGAALLGGAGLSSAAAGAIGSGLATAAVTGDLEQGILSGLTGFGLGQAFGAAGDVAAKAGTEAATSGVTQGLTDATMQGVQSITPDALNIQPLSAGTAQGFPTSSMANASMQSFLPISQQADLLSQGLTAPTTQAATESARTAADLTATQRMAAPFTQPGTLLNQLTSPGSFLPMYVGETGRMAREQELMGRGSMAAYEEDQEAQRQKTLRQMGDVFNQVRSAYPGVGYAQGGMVERYFDGGSLNIEENIRQAMLNSQFGGLPSAENVQLSLRGSQFVPPPASSYSALDVGGEGYLAGMAPEFQYFREPPPATTPPGGGGGTTPGGGGGTTPGGGKPPWWPPDAPWPPGGATTPGGGGTAPGDGGGGGGAADIMGGTGEFDFGNFLSGFRGIQNIYGRPGAGADVGAGAGQPAGREPVGTGVIEPTGPEDLVMYPGGSATFDETAGAGAGIPAGGEFDTSILQDLLNQQPTTPVGATPIAQPETPAFTQPQLPPFTGINIADLERRLAELNLSQEAPISVENDTQYDPNRGRQVFETPQITFDTESIPTQPDIPVGRPARQFEDVYTQPEIPIGPPNIPTRFEPEPEITRGIGAFKEPAVSYTPPEVYRSPQPVEMEPVSPPPAMIQPEPIVQPPPVQPPPPPVPAAQPPARRTRAARAEPVATPAPVARAPESVVQAPLMRETPPAMRPQPTVEPPVARAPVAPAIPASVSRLQELINNAGGGRSVVPDRAPQAAPAAPMPVAPPPVAAPPVAAAPVEIPGFDPQLLEQLIAMSRGQELAPQPQPEMGFGGAADFGGPVGDFGVSDFFAEGGMVNGTDNAMGEENSIVDMTVAAIRGEIDNADRIIQRFVEMYGPEVFMQLREQVLQEIVPGAQTNGMVEGEGGGQDDLVNGMIGTQRPVAVSPGEYIIPADVVSLAGGGYSGDGAKYFDSLIDDIRQKTMGTTEQIRPYRRSG